MTSTSHHHHHQDEGYSSLNGQEDVSSDGGGGTTSSSGGPAASVLPPSGPVQIIETVEEDHTFRLNEAALREILLNPKCIDRQVAVISVAGAFRKGKSFLLNFLLRYAGWSSGEELEGGDWMGKDDGRLEGFSWRGGSDRETNGILMWREPFLIDVDGEEVALILLDTQGAFDSQSTVKDCATIFALSTMLSSVQIYNLSQNIQEDDLQHLQLFTEYGRLALEDSNMKPFQSLMFLVRDWSFPYEAEYGFQGGQRILDKRLEVSDKQHPELQQLRKHIKSCFDTTSCFLLPHPGLKVATNPEFNGQLSEIEAEFKQQLRVIVPRLLSPDNLVLKRINGAPVTCRELVEYFLAYMSIFSGEELPEPKSMLWATAEANNLAAVACAKANYCKGMEEICGGDSAYMNPDELRREHDRVHEESISLFKDTKKMGGAEFSTKFLDKLDIELEEQFENFAKVNTGKNLFRSAKTPATLFILLVINYILQEIFQFISLQAFATTCGSFLGIIIITLVTWAYARYSGALREVASTIDDVANNIWEHVLNPLTTLAVTEGSRQMVTLTRRLSENHNGPSRQTSRC